MFIKLFNRKGIGTLILVLLLSLCMAFCGISTSLRQSVQRQLAEIDSEYVTTASVIPGEVDYSKGIVSETDDGVVVYDDGTKWYPTSRITEFAEEAPGFSGFDRAVLYSVHTPGNRGLSSGALDYLEYLFEYDYCYNLSVIAVKCVSTEKLTVGNYYDAEFELVDVISRNPVYDLPNERKDIWLDFCDLFTEEGEIPFEPGKTYIFRGMFQDYTIRQSARLKEPGSKEIEFYWNRDMNELWREQLFTIQRQQFQFVPTNAASYHEDAPDFASYDFARKKDSIHPNFYLTVSRGANEYGSIPHSPDEGWPFYAEYSGDWEDYLNSEEGRVWREEIIPACERNWNSAPLLLTDRVEGLYSFAIGDASLNSGRMITKEEYESGAKVCLVSTAYAMYNDLEIGDVITVDLYKPAYQTNSPALEEYLYPKIFLYTFRYPLVEEYNLNTRLEYTIVGLYTSPNQPAEPNGNNFRPDTIFAPKASVPGSEQYEDTATPVLNTLILKNGSIEEFEAYMNEKGVVGKFQYFDYGYSEMKASLEAMTENAKRMALLGVAVFCLGLALFLVLNLRRMAPTVRGMRLIGIKAGSVAAQMFAALAAVGTAAAVLGTGLSALLYDTVCKAVLSQSVELDAGSLLLCGAAELLVILTLCGITAISGSRINLMGNKKTKK